MSYSFAHELSQPLTAILMDVHTIKQNLGSDASNHQALRDAAQGIERNATRTAQLIDRIRHFIRPSLGEFEPVDMKVLVQDVRELLLHDMRHQKVVLDWTLDVEPCMVMGDKVQLSQIVLNVYRNALQAMAQSQVRSLYVSVDRQEQRVVVRVRDTGLGLAESIRQRVGEPFVTSKADGLGLGLLISKAIAERHGGSLTITNAVDGGALVELNLPAADA
jgi:two-component system sensor kinase FixL